MATRERTKAAARREARKAKGPSATLRWLRMSPRKVRLHERGDKYQQNYINISLIVIWKCIPIELRKGCYVF